MKCSASELGNKFLKIIQLADKGQNAFLFYYIERKGEGRRKEKVANFTYVL